MNGPYPLVPLAEVLTQYTEYIEAPEPRLYPKLSVKLYGKGVVLDTPADGSTLMMKRHQISKAGQIILSEIWGKKGAIGFVPPEGEGALCTSHFFLFDVRPDRVAKDFLQLLFRANYLQDQLDSEAKGTTGYAAVRPKYLLAAKIPLPPLDEQRRIVLRIEGLAAKIEEAKKLRNLASEEVTAMETSSTELCFERLLRNGVPSYPFEEVSERITVGHVSSMRHAYRETGVPFLRSQNVRKNRFDSEGLCFIAREFHEANPKSSLGPGDVVIVRTGFVGVACVIPTTLKEANCADLVIVRPGSKLDPEYAARFLNSASGKNRATSASVGSAQKHYNVGAMRRTQIPLPPLEEQRRVVAHLDNLQARVDATRKLQSETATELDALMPSILSKAFRGEL